jgi:hypothetical protein
MSDDRFFAHLCSRHRRDDAVGRLARRLMFEIRTKQCLRLSTVLSVRTYLASRGAGADALAGLAQAEEEFAARAHAGEEQSACKQS